jgi:hypothetical protein
VIRPRLDVPYAVPLIGFDAYPILADADEIGVLPIDDIPSTFLARDVEASAIGPNSTDMRDGLMRIMRVGLSDAGYLTSTTLADLLTPLLAANPFLTMRASLRR